MDSSSGLKDISLTIYGLTKTIKGLSESTVCDDVIETVFDTLAISKIYASSFAIYEFAAGIERQLHGKTRVLKLVRSWEAEHAQFRLTMKRIENLNGIVGVASEESSSIENDAYRRNQTHKDEKNYALMQKNCYQTKYTPKLNRSRGCSKIQNISRISNIQKDAFDCLALPTAPETSGKMFILNKYLNDVLDYHEKMKPSSPKARTLHRTLGDGSDLECAPSRRNSQKVCEIRNSRNDFRPTALGANIRTQNDISPVRISRSDSRRSKLGENIRTPGDGEHSVSASSESLDIDVVDADYNEVRVSKHSNEATDLNDAFLVTGEDLYGSYIDISDDVETDKCYNNLDFTEDKYNVRRGKGGPKRREKYGLNRLQNNKETLKNILAFGSPSSASSEDELVGSILNTKMHRDNSFRQCL